MCQALTGEDAELDFSDVEPRCVLWGVMDLQPIRQRFGFFGREDLIQGGRGMGVEIVHDEHHLVRLDRVLFKQLLHEGGPIFLRAPLAHFEIALARERLTGDEHIACFFLLIGVVLAPGLAWFHVLRGMLFLDHFLEIQYSKMGEVPFLNGNEEPYG
jgi:hypothetical protein